MEQTFGAFLAERRKANNLTQRALAEQLFVSESAVSKWEKDVARPDISLLPKLSTILGVSEHELITASIDTDARTEKKQAKRWRALTFTWRLFFLFGYGIALLVCFICNLAIDKRLDWFWIVFSSLLLAATFTNTPRYIKKYRLALIPLSQFGALALLLLTCALYNGDVSWLPTALLSVLLGLTAIFFPICIAKYPIFEKVRKFGDFISVGVVFVVLNLLLITCDFYSLGNGYMDKHWYLQIALPIVCVCFAILLVLMSVRLLKTNRFIKTGIIFSLLEIFLYVIPRFIKTKSPIWALELEQCNPFNADFSVWTVANDMIEKNVHCIVFLSLLLLALIFLAVGIIRAVKNHAKNK
ncbi:MAG: helix-turn-helix transcriptional regulator [Clostridiales bacterium]|nr:helix-turn-helix transcriptional regulator [Clostridiales bacterium]